MKAWQSLSLLVLFLHGTFLLAQTGKPRRADCFFGVHFDLHASEDITDAGKTLTYEMVDTFLKRVLPDFIQIDCKGHPGISSYPTRVGYPVKGFEKDPLKLWREATEKNHVSLFMHFSGVWDGKVVQEHPEWAVIMPNGERSTRKVSFFSPYLDTYMIPQLKELSGDYHVDGAWIDGECWAVEPDYGEASVKRFTQETGITVIPKSPSDPFFPEWLEYTRTLFREHLNKYVEAIHAFNPDFQITSNWAYSSMMPEKVTIGLDYLSGDVTPQNGVFRSAFEARCLASQGLPWDLMAWGFSWNGGDMPMSIKSAVQLKQEAAQIMAMGGGVQFYFQQNRDLSLKPWLAYMLHDIGSFCRERRTFCHKAVAVPQIALLYPSKAYQRSAPVAYARSLEMLQGTLYALLDGQHAVEILMEHSITGKMNRYPLIIVPECDYLDPAFLEELRTYARNGGKLLVLGAETAGLFKAELGIGSCEIATNREAFISAGGKIGSIRSDLLLVELTGNAHPKARFYKGSDFLYPDVTLAASSNPFGKGVVAGVYFNAGTAYSKYKTPVIRDFLDEILGDLFPDQLVDVSGSDLVHVAVNRKNGRIMVNLVNVAGEHTNQSALGYDEVPALQGLTVAIRTSEKPAGIIQQPTGTELPFSYSQGMTTITLPVLKLHEILEVY